MTTSFPHWISKAFIFFIKPLSALFEPTYFIETPKYKDWSCSIWRIYCLYEEWNLKFSLDSSKDELWSVSGYFKLKEILIIVFTGIRWVWLPRDCTSLKGMIFFRLLTLLLSPQHYIVFFVAISFSWNVQQLDVQNAFLYGVLQEDIYMLQPLCLIDLWKPHHVCKLQNIVWFLSNASNLVFMLK